MDGSAFKREATASPLPSANSIHGFHTSHPRQSTTSASQHQDRYATPPIMDKYEQPGYNVQQYQNGYDPGYLEASPSWTNQDDGQNIGTPHTYSTTATTSPSTPQRHQDFIMTRSGLSIPKGSNPLGPQSTQTSRIKKPAQRKKRERAKAPRKMTQVKIDSPLSELTRDMALPVQDIEAYVNRSSETRRREVETGKIPGKVKRPMNAFMLYRKAYQNRCKEWCTHNNHQVVSQVCGDSWPLEPPAVKDQFVAWAALERVNHTKAHPEYKFKPTKPNKKKKEELESDDESDWGGKRRSVRPRTADSDLPRYNPTGPTAAAGVMYQQGTPPPFFPANRSNPYSTINQNHAPAYRPYYQQQQPMNSGYAPGYPPSSNGQEGVMPGLLASPPLSSNEFERYDQFSMYPDPQPEQHYGQGYVGDVLPQMAQPMEHGIDPSLRGTDFNPSYMSEVVDSLPLQPVQDWGQSEFGVGMGEQSYAVYTPDQQVQLYKGPEEYEREPRVEGQFDNWESQEAAP